jgi:hypothetical protein
MDKMIVFERAGLLFIFNFHPTQSYTDYRVGVEEPGEYHIALSSDENQYGGFDNIARDTKYFTTPMEWNGRKNWLHVGFRWNSQEISFADIPAGLYSIEDLSCPRRIETNRSIKTKLLSPFFSPSPLLVRIE